MLDILNMKFYHFTVTDYFILMRTRIPIMTPHVLAKPARVAREIRQEYLANKVRIPLCRPELCYFQNSMWKAFHVLYPIAEFLSPVEILNLSHVHRTFKTPQTMNLMFRQFKDNLYGLMRDSGHSALVQHLTMTSAKPWPFVVSGSIVLQSLLSVRWDKFDIDIYGKTDGVNLIQKFLSESSYQNSYIRGDTHDQYIVLQATDSLKAVKDWYNYQSEQNTLPLSIVQIIELSDHITQPAACVHSFDLDIVKNSWNGKSLRIFDCLSLVQKTAKIADYIEQILGAMGNLSGSLANSFRRLYNLQKSRLLSIDLTLWNLSLSDDITSSVFTKIVSRFLKYAKRGFIIKGARKIWTLHDIIMILHRLGKSRTNMQRLNLISEILKISSAEAIKNI
jgi:hypothetical protein